MTTQTWNVRLYENQHAFVWQHGAALLELLQPKPGDSILDLGCGTGQLTAQIAQSGAAVQGIDSSPTMIEQARQHYPNLPFWVGDARTFHLDQPLDAVFSNAVLHWVKPPEQAIAQIYTALKPGGRFVAEFGGHGNVQAIAEAVAVALDQLDSNRPRWENPWYFPSVGKYASQLEQQGFEVSQAALFDRPTPLEGGDAGLANWLRMFASSTLANLSLQEQQQLFQTVEAQLFPTLYQQDHWIADYRRIRIVAVRSALDSTSEKLKKSSDGTATLC